MKFGRFLLSFLTYSVFLTRVKANSQDVINFDISDPYPLKAVVQGIVDRRAFKAQLDPETYKEESSFPEDVITLDEFDFNSWQDGDEDY